MTASYIAQVTGTNTATLPSHQAGDLFIAFAKRAGSSNAPLVPNGNGWVTVASSGSNALGFALATLACASASEVAGTFTNATGLTILQYRPASGFRLEIGGFQTAGSASSLTVSTPAITFVDQAGTSWAVSVMAHNSTDLTGLSTPPTGMTNRSTLSANSMAANDTNGPVFSWSTQSVTYGGTAAAARSFAIELRVIRNDLVSKNFYFRTNYLNSTSRFFRTNEINAAGAQLAQATASGAGIAYASVIGANIDTSILSAFYNLDFTPVNGDRVALPTTWQGSTITVQPSGFFSISPALPHGTQIPRRSYDVSATTWYQDTITINNGAGTGSLNTTSVAVSGAGSSAAPRTGTGAASTPTPTVTASGSVTTTRGIIRTMVTKAGAPVSAGTQVRAIVFSDLTPGFTVLYNAVHTIGSGGILSFTSPSLPAVGTTVILALYDPGASSTGDQDIGMSARRVQIVNVT